MSGPALKHWDSHSSIHEAALGEAAELTELLGRCLERGDSPKALEVACIAVEHWETRTLRHAEAEEEGLYKDITAVRPQWQETITALMRDHTLMRNLLRDIKRLLAEEGAGYPVLQRFQAMMLVDELHNRDEQTIVTDSNVLDDFHQRRE